MNKFTDWLERKLVPIATVLKKEKHLQAVTNALMSCMVILLIGGLACILASPPLDYTTMSVMNPFRYLFIGWSALSEATSTLDWWLYSLTIGLLALWASFGIGYYLSDTYKVNPLIGGIVALLATLTINCANTADGGLAPTYLSASGLFAAIIVSLLAVELYRFLVQKKVGYIKMPSGVPQAISAQFESLVPMLILAVAALCVRGCFDALGTPLPALILKAFQPLISGADTLFGMGIACTLEQLLWWFGIHNSAIDAVINPIYTNNLAMNAAAYAAGTSPYNLPYVFTGAFWFFQGFGYYIPLVGLLCLSKSKQCKNVGKVALIPALFNVGEPLMFGMPICMNPIMLIPWVLTRLLHIIVFGGLMKIGILAKTFLYPTWTLPVILGVYISTFDLMQIVVMVLLLVADTVIWYPFFKTYEKTCLEEERTEEVLAL